MCTAKHASKKEVHRWHCLSLPCPNCSSAFRAGEGVALIRESVRMLMQELIETEATHQIGTGRYERTEARTCQRSCNSPG